MAEQVFFEDDSVKVTQARFMVHGQTYTMQGVTSIRHFVEEPSKKGSIILGLIGVIVFFVSFGIFSESAGGGAVTLLIGAAMVGLAVLWFRSLKATHVVALSSASGESRALTTKDSTWANQVLAALNDAIVARG